jgi:plasmid stability protein
MAAVTIRNLPDAVHRALRARAARNNRSTEAEMRAILEDVVQPAERVLLGSALSAAGQQAGLANADVEALEAGFERTAAEPMRFP